MTRHRSHFASRTGPIALFAVIVACLITLRAPSAADAQDPRFAPDGSNEVRLVDLIKEVSLAYSCGFMQANKFDSVYVQRPAIGEATDRDQALWRFACALRLQDLAYYPVYGFDRPTYVICRTEDVGRRANPTAASVADLPGDVCFGGLILDTSGSDPASLQRALLNVCSRPGGTIQPLTRTPALYVQDWRDSLEQIEKIVRMLTQTTLDEDTTTAIALTNANANDAYKAMERLFEDEARTGRIRMTPNNDFTSLLLRGAPEVVDEVSAALKMYDTKRAD